MTEIGAHDSERDRTLATLNNAYWFLCHQALEPVRKDMLRLGYAWDDKEESWRRTFEEHLVRAAQIWITCGEAPESAERAAANQVRHGFRYVPSITTCFRLHWSGIDSAQDFVTHCLHACQKYQA